MFQSRSFFLSVLLGNLLLIVLILGIGFFATSREVGRQTSQLTERFQEQLLKLVRDDLQESWPDVDQRIRQYCDSYAQEPDFRLTIVDLQGRVMGESELASEKMMPHLTKDRPEILTALTGKRGEDVRNSKTKNIPYRYLAEPISKDGHVVAAVRVAFPLSGIAEHKRLFLHGILLGFTLMLLAAVVLTFLLGWLWNKPLRILNEEAKRIAEGNLEPSASIDGPLELTQLSQSLETMRRTVSRQLGTITRQREGLQTILQNLPDSIFAMNRTTQVIYFNEAARKLFRLEPHAGQAYLQELVRSATIVEWYLEQRKTRNRVSPSGKIERKEIDLFGRKHFLELEFVETDNASKEDAASLLIVSDLTETVRANRMKTDFVANASHELRTPLAAIRAALDNISDDVYDDRSMLEKIVKIVDRHVSRLDALIEDLLALHGAEDETISARLEKTNVDEQRTWLEELFQKRLAEKKLALSVHSNFGETSFRIDNKRLGLILQNLIDNAIKFTPEGGGISLDFDRDGSFLVISCRDNGCGIAFEEQQRVFERFYQGDSSKTGDGRIRGTGLGLAIVKHAVERLKGNIFLESRIAQGSVFSIRLPVEFDYTEVG